MSSDVAVIDFGSCKITVLIGERGINNTLNIKGMGVSDYAGFSDGEWLNPEELGRAVSGAISAAESNYGQKIAKLYVGVPGEFTSVIVNENTVNIGKKHKITDEDRERVLNVGGVSDVGDFSLINVQPVYFTLENGLKVINPVGYPASKLSGLVSEIFAENKFIDSIGGILAKLGISDVEYISSCLAESLFLFDGDTRDKTAVLIDIGYITSSVVVIKGDGILSLSSFSMGGGHIAGDLATCLKIPFSQAESLKRKAILSLNPSDSDIYEIKVGDSVKTFSAKLVNEIVGERIRIISKAVLKCLSLCSYEIPDYLAYCLTGGGISFIRGAKDALSFNLGKNVEIVAPAIPQVNRPNLSSSWGLLDLAVRTEKPKKKGFFAKLFKA